MVGTCKYRPEYPGALDSLEVARARALCFERWYNRDHKHRNLQFVISMQRRSVALDPSCLLQAGISKSSFRASELGPSRMGESDLLRFFRKEAIIRQSGTALSLAEYSEESLRD
ncbi:MAG: hypothetical protein ABIT36_04950 [Steroidobacteraceae bacterium]